MEAAAMGAVLEEAAEAVALGDLAAEVSGAAELRVAGRIGAWAAHYSKRRF